MHGFDTSGTPLKFSPDPRVYQTSTPPVSQPLGRPFAQGPQRNAGPSSTSAANPAHSGAVRGHFLDQGSITSEASPARSTGPSISSISSSLSQSTQGSPVSPISSQDYHPILTSKTPACVVAVPSEPLMQYPSPDPSPLSGRSPGSSALQSPLVSHHDFTAPSASHLSRRVERDLPPLPPPESPSEGTPSSPYSLRRQLRPSNPPSSRTARSIDSREIDSPRSANHPLRRQQRPSDEHPYPADGGHGRSRMNSAGTAAMTQGLRMLGKASASAWKSVQQGRAERQGSADSPAPQSPASQTWSTRQGSMGEEATSGNRKQPWATRGLGNLRNLSSHASKSASSLVAATGRRKTDEDPQASWDVQSARLQVPTPSGGTVPSRSSSSSSGGGRSVDYAFPPAPIATPDPNIGLPYQVQHNVHVDIGPEGYRGLPASWARYLAEKHQGADEEDPRLQLESRMEVRQADRFSDEESVAHADGDVERLEGSDDDQRQVGTEERARELEDTIDEWDYYHGSRHPTSSVSTRDDSSGRRTARPSMAVSRASTSYSSVLNKGWDDWSDAGATPPPPVPPLPLPAPPSQAHRRMSGVSPMTRTTEYADGRDDTTPRESGDEDEMHASVKSGNRSDGNRLGLGLNLGFEAVSSSSTSKDSPLLPEFLTGGSQEDDDWAAMLLKSIPAEGEEPGSIASKALQSDNPARKSGRQSSMRNQKSRSKLAPADSHGGGGLSPNRTSQRQTRDLLSPRASVGSRKTRASGQPPPMPPVSPRDTATFSGTETRPSSRASRKSRKSRNPSRAASRRTTRTIKTSGAEWSESEEDEGDYTGEDESDDAQISTAKTEKMGRVTAPRALTHSQFVDTVRSSPGSNSEGGSFASPTLPSPVPDAKRPGDSDSPLKEPQAVTQSSSSAPHSRRPQVPQLFIDPRLAESAYHKKYGTAVIAALDGESSAEATQPKSGWSVGSTSPKVERTAQQPTTPGPLARLKMGALAANARKVAAAAAAASPVGANHSLFSMKTSAASKSTPTLSKRTDASSRIDEPMPANANPRVMVGKSPVPSEAIEGLHTPDALTTPSPSATSPSMPTSHILGLRERRKMNAPARIYPPSASQTGKIRHHGYQNNLPDSDSGHVGSSDAGSVANGSLAGRTESSSSIAAGALRSKGSNSSLTGHLRKGSIRGLFRRESQEREHKAGRPSEGSIGGSSASHSHTDSGAGYSGLISRGISRDRSGSSASQSISEAGPKVPPKDSLAQGLWTAPSRAPPIGFIRPDANGFFSVPQSTRSASNASVEGQGLHSATSTALTSDHPSPRRVGSDWGEGEDGDYGADEYLEQWVHGSGPASSAARSPGAMSAFSDMSTSRSTRRAGPSSPSYTREKQLGLPSPGHADGKGSKLLSPSARSFTGNTGHHGGASGASSPASYREKALPSPGYFDQQHPSGAFASSQQGHDSSEAPSADDGGLDAQGYSSRSRIRSVPGLEYLGYSPEAVKDQMVRAAGLLPPDRYDSDDPDAPHRSSIASMPDQELTSHASKQTRPVPSPDHDVLEAAIATRPSSRMSTSSKTSKRATRTPRRSTDTRNRFPVSMHYASGFSDTFFDVPDGSEMPRESFDLDDVLPQHLNDVPPVPPLPVGNQYSVPASPMGLTRVLPSRAGAQTPKSPKVGALGGISPGPSRAPSRNSSTRKSPRRRSRSRSRAHLPSGVASSRKFDMNLPDAVKPAARFLSSADPERVFVDLSLIGSGDSGDVFSAVGPGGASSGSTSMSGVPGSEVVAIKVIKIHAPRDSKTEQEHGVSRLDALSSELALWTACKHDHILALYDVFYAPQNSQRPGVWISQELADRSLADIVSLKPSGLTITEAHMAKFLSDVLEALTALHSKLIVHRDVRSDNVLICSNGMAKLSDFTHAVQLEAEGPESKRKSVVGTAYWMAPELIKAQSYDVAVDIWSLGATLFELCEGDPPNVSLPPTRAIQQIAQFGLPPLTNADQYSTALRAFLKSTTEMRPKHRSTAKTLLQTDFILNCCSNGQIVELMDEARDVEESLADDEEDEGEHEEMLDDAE